MWPQLIVFVLAVVLVFLSDLPKPMASFVSIVALGFAGAYTWWKLELGLEAILAQCILVVVWQMWLRGLTGGADAKILMGLVLIYGSGIFLAVSMAGGVIGWQLGGLLVRQVQIAPEWDRWLDWGGAILGALLVASVAYAFYVVGVLVAVGGFGYNLGITTAPSLGLVGWQITAVAGVLAVGLVVLALVTQLPKLVMVVLTAIVGAGAIVSGTLPPPGTWLYRVYVSPHVED